MRELMPRKQEQPIQMLTMISADQLAVLSLREAKRGYFVRPVFDYSRAKSSFGHISAYLIAPTGGKLIELIIILISVACRVASKVRNTDVGNHVNVLEFR